ncbi:MAG TPA: hypothetical protein VNF47_06240 [Streptosporangiaceae bacterium]|nr:hypothetical protein [Streptosporangiaceae bacterium]
MAGMLRVRRSRGAFSGVLLVLLGIWGGLIPFVGPYAHFAFTPDRAWVLTSGRIWLEILPGIGAFLGGIVMLISRLRPMAMLGAIVALVSGGWFAFGSALAPLWTHNLPAQGVPVGGQLARAMEQVGFFTGLGAVIVFVASLALGRLSVVSVADVRRAQEPPAAADAVGTVPADEEVTIPGPSSGSFSTASSTAPRTTMTKVLSRPRSGADAPADGSAP